MLTLLAFKLDSRFIKIKEDSPPISTFSITVSLISIFLLKSYDSDAKIKLPNNNLIFLILHPLRLK